MKKVIEGPEAFSMEAFQTVDDGEAATRLKDFCNITFENPTGKFVCKAWLKVFTINEPVIHSMFGSFCQQWTLRTISLESMRSVCFSSLGDKGERGEHA